MRLLIADDDITSRTMLEAISRVWGFEPILAEDGEIAQEILKQDNPPRLVLLDWEMPKLDGIALCKWVRETKSRNPAYIILLTGRHETRDIVTGLNAGANDFVTKPFDNAELQARLRVGRRMLELQTEVLEIHGQLQFQASHDPLTGLLNRGAVLENLEKELARSQRDKSTLGIALCDIDHFKGINDNHGHLVGDDVLRELSRRVAGTLRPYDHIGRYGGEEFLVVVNGQEHWGPEPFERIRTVVSDSPFQLDGLSLPLSVSIGVARFSGTANAWDLNELLNTADMALYDAKKNGRNQVVLAA